MYAVTIPAPGPAHVLTPTHVPEPELASGRVIIQVAAAGINRADILQRRGLYPPPATAPPWPGLEVSGTVIAVADDVERWSPGDRVVALLDGGGYAEYVSAPHGLVLPVPEGISLVDAAGLPEACATIWSTLHDVARLQRGEWLLLHGGSGGVGSVGLQIAQAWGARVITTARGADRIARCRELGASYAIDHTMEDFASQVMQITQDRGVDVVLDMVGAAYLSRHLHSVAPEGRIVIIGLQQGRHAEIDLAVMLSRRITLAGTTLRSRPEAQKVAIMSSVEQYLWPLVSSGQLRPVIHATLPFSKAAEAHRMLEDGEVFGKVLLLPQHPDCQG